MELEHTTVKELKLYDSVVREQPVEADIALPEYYPAVGRILKCFVDPSEESVTFSEGRVSVAGAAAVRVLYADDENALHCYRTEVKYTKILPTDVRDEHAAVRVTQDVRSLNCRALGPKRLEIKAGIAVRAELLGIRGTQIVTAAGENLQLRTETADCCEPVCVYCREFTESETLRCDAGGKKLRTVIDASAVPVTEKTEIISNKIMVRGRNRVTVLCAAEDGSVARYELSVPFSEVLDCYGVSEQTAVNVVFSRSAAEASLQDDTDNVFDVSVKNDLLILATQQRELTYVSDAYALRGEAECAFSELTVARAVAQGCEEEHISAETEAYEDGGFSVKAVFVNDISYAVANRSADGCVEGSLCFNVLIADEEGRFSLLTKNVTFEHRLPEGASCTACQIVAKNAQGERMAGGKLSVACTLELTLLTENGSPLRMLTGVKESADAAAAGQEKAVVYFAEKGETLWDIAKENRTSVANIKAYNALSSEVLETDARLIFSCF
ncbi:MAG: DUF3794 domain-containing protein [Clostridia bacterium]|nr:DUF3794 domain-containing protein [Clostridia bacterium]